MNFADKYIITILLMNVVFACVMAFSVAAWLGVVFLFIEAFYLWMLYSEGKKRFS